MKKNKLDILKTQGTGFKTPEAYFDTLEDEVMLKLAAEKFPKKEGFTVPTNYLENVEESVFNKLNEFKASEELKGDIPKGYFNSIEDRVFEKLKEEKISQPKVIPLRSRFVKILVPIAVAASLLLVFIINYNNDKITIENVASSEIDTWIEDDLITLDANQIAEVFSDVELNIELNNDDQELLEYLNGTDIESILNN